MKISQLARLSAIALVLFVAAAATAQTSKKTDRRSVVIKDGQVYSLNGDGSFPWVVARGYVGVQMIDLTPELREHFHVQKNAGVLVGKVMPDSPAAKAGLRVGDIITAVDGAPIDSAADLTRAVRDKKKGDTIRLDYARDGSNATAVATIVERERKEIDLRSFDITIPDLEGLEVGRHLGQYFSSPEWKTKVEHLQQLPDCADMQQRLRDLESKMKDLEKRMGQK